MNNSKYAKDAELGGELAKFFRQRVVDMRLDNLTQGGLGAYCGIAQMTVSRFERALPTSTSFKTMALYSLALDVPLDMLVSMLQLDMKVKEHLVDPDYKSRYVNLKHLTDSTAHTSPLESLLADVPEENKRQARKLILSVIESFK